MMTIHNNSGGAQSGFTLIDLLVALVLFSLGVLGMVEMQAKMSQVSTGSEERVAASTLADEMVADVQMYGGSVASGVQTAWQNKVQNQLPAGTVTVATSAVVATTTNFPIVAALPLTPPTTITITINWTPPSRTQTGAKANTYVTEFNYP